MRKFLRKNAGNTRPRGCQNFAHEYIFAIEIEFQCKFDDHDRALAEFIQILQFKVDPHTYARESLLYESSKPCSSR